MPRSGMSWDAEVEWRQAAQWAGYKFEDFQVLPGEQQAGHVAAYRITQQAEAVLAHERVRESQPTPAPANGRH